MVKNKGYSILLIEDNRQVALLTQEILEDVGHRVTLAFDGESGVEAARQQQPQVVLCDIRLPGSLNGFDVAKALRSDPLLNPYLVALSAHDADEFRDRALEAGFDNVMSKPIDIDALELMVAEKQSI